jgi:hypothetical protein
VIVVRGRATTAAGVASSFTVTCAFAIAGTASTVATHGHRQKNLIVPAFPLVAKPTRGLGIWMLAQESLPRALGARRVARASAARCAA